jgi:hypothetical protein
MIRGKNLRNPNPRANIREDRDPPVPLQSRRRNIERERLFAIFSRITPG